MAGEYFTTLNSDNGFCATFGRYPSYVAGILNSVKQIRINVLCTKQIRQYILKNVLQKSAPLSCLQNSF